MHGPFHLIFSPITIRLQLHNYLCIQSFEFIEKLYLEVLIEKFFKDFHVRVLQACDQDQAPIIYWAW